MKRLTKNTRISALFLFAALLLSSCGAEETVPVAEVDTSSETETVAVSTETELTSIVDAIDYDGYDFRVLVREADGDSIYWNEIGIEEADGTPVNDAIFERNLWLSEKFNISITAVYDNYYLDDYTMLLQAGEDAFDTGFVGMRKAFQEAAEGYLLALQTTPLDADRPWWNNKCYTDTEVNGKNYFILGDMNIVAYDSMPAMYYNKQMLVDNGFAEPYDMVFDGKWTFDAMLEMSSVVSSDLNGDGKYDQTDAYGMGCSSYAALCFAYGSGVNFARFQDDAYSIMVDERFLTYFQRVIETITTDNTIMYSEKYGSANRTAYLLTAFQENRLLFLPDGMTRTNNFRDMETNFGILPIPKQDETQAEYCAFIHQDDSSVVTIPITNQDPVRTAHILEDMAFYSHQHLRPAYIDTTLKTKFLRDEESSQVVDLILRSVRFDLAMVSGNKIVNDLRQLLTNGKTELASHFTANQAVYNKDIDFITEYMMGE